MLSSDIFPPTFEIGRQMAVAISKQKNSSFEDFSFCYGCHRLPKDRAKVVALLKGNKDNSSPSPRMSESNLCTFKE